MGKVEAPAIDSATPGVSEAAYVKLGYELEVTTNPTAMYAGTVKAKAAVTLTTDGEMILSNGAEPSLAEHGSLAVSFGPVSVSIPAAGGWVDYGS